MEVVAANVAENAVILLSDITFCLTCAFGKFFTISVSGAAKGVTLPATTAGVVKLSTLGLALFVSGAAVGVVTAVAAGAVTYYHFKKKDGDAE